jgi:hypothetical protein
MESVIIGDGEIGTSLHKVIGGSIVGKIENTIRGFDIIHICFPYSNEFISEVK